MCIFDAICRLLIPARWLMMICCFLVNVITSFSASLLLFAVRITYFFDVTYFSMSQLTYF